MKSFPYYTTDGANQVGDIVITPESIAVIKCLDARPTLAQIYMRQPTVPPVFVKKEDILNYLMPITVSEKLDRSFVTALGGTESVSGSVNVGGSYLNFASSGVPAIYTRQLDALSLTVGKKQEISLMSAIFTGNASVKIKYGSFQVIYTAAQVNAILAQETGLKFITPAVVDATDDLEISLINATVASTLKVGRLNIQEESQEALSSFSLLTPDGVSSIGTLYLSRQFGLDEGITAYRMKIGSPVAQLYFADGSLQGPYVDTTALANYLAAQLITVE